MAFIDIISNNQTRQNRNTVTYEDNWVYIPGNTITGDGSKPYLITDLEEFKSQFGSYSPEGSITYEYVSGILNAGLPVLFRRIVTSGTSSSNSLVSKATYSITKSKTGEETKIINYATFTEKYGGSFGNKLFVKIRKTNKYYYIDVKYGTNENTASTLETVKLMEIIEMGNPPTVEQLNEYRTKMVNALKTVSLSRVDITNVFTYTKDGEQIPVEDITDFDIDFFDTWIEGSGKLNPDTQATNIVKLDGGSDIGTDTTSLTALYTGVATSFSAVNDKLLYNPKYLTTGGICSPETYSGNKSVMIEKMLELSRIRQDCIALVDLPKGLPYAKDDTDNYQHILSKYSYSQTSDTQALESALTVGPWYNTLLTTGKYDWMPGSYAYLTVVGRDISAGGKTYTPKAGNQAGRLNYVTETEFDIGSDILEQWQSEGDVNINPIIRIQGGNFSIAGNSTLLVKDEDEENIYSEISAVMAIIEIKRLAYTTAMEYQYLYNSVEAFENFSLTLASRLDSMKAEGAVYKWDIINNSSNAEPRKLKILLNVWLTPTIRSIEIYLNIAYGDIELNTEGGNN